jgi:hypothetical protein
VREESEPASGRAAGESEAGLLSDPTVRLGAAVFVPVLVAMIPVMPYGYYPVMRWIVCPASLGMFVCLRDRRIGDWSWAWVVIAGIYNPIFPVHASRGVWLVVNAATLVLVVVTMVAVARGRRAEGAP